MSANDFVGSGLLGRTLTYSPFPSTLSTIRRHFAGRFLKAAFGAPFTKAPTEAAKAPKRGQTFIRDDSTMGFALRAIAAEVEKQRERFLLGAENALRAPRRKMKRCGKKSSIGSSAKWVSYHRPGYSARGEPAAPYDAGDVGRVIATLSPVSIRRMCRVLKFPRAPLRARYILRLRYHHDSTRCWRNGSKDRSKDIRPLVIAGLGIAALR